MRQFDWISVCEENGINYRSRGANVAHGNINVHCPFCGAGDPSFHLGISLNGKGWGCWRNSAHRGKSTVYLLRALLGSDATAVIRAYQIDEVRGVVRRFTYGEEGDSAATQRPASLAWPAESEPLDAARHRVFADYLIERGFRSTDIARLAEEFALRVCRFGHYNSRILIPYILRGRPVFFTGRAIRSATLRYKAMPHDAAVVDPKTICFNQDAIDNPAGIILCEGQIDAIKTTLYGPLPGVGLNSNHATPEQIKALSAANRVFMILDNDKGEEALPGTHSEQTLALYHDLIRAGVHCRPVPMPRGYKDLGEIPWRRFPHLITLDYLLCA